ncbi:MAG: hypothetical protein GX267_02110 [Fibrobacter sp.]|jgi:hypothetical protein|nr:hypothetical protein [Fibrobacter sp.]
MRTKNIILIVAALLLSCVVPSEPPEKGLAISLCSPDTISPYSPLKLVFSSPLEDSQLISFHFSPPFFEYYKSLSLSKDTLEVVPTSPFMGNTRYNFIARGDSFSFYTYAHEKEPNNTITTADHFTAKMFGSVSNVNDTDCFIIEDSIVRFYLRSYYSESVFLLSDIKGRVTSPRIYRPVDSLSVPDSFIYPLILRVFSHYRSSGGYYEIGKINS